MNKLNVSVVICTYNSGDVTRRAIESVLNQNCQNVECIVIDGGSNDATLDILRYYSNNPNFKYISEFDSGIYNAMNKGWKMAKGLWIYYLGADDELLPNGLLDLFNQADDINNSDIIYGNILYRKINGCVSLHTHHTHRQLPWKTFACHQGLIMRRTLLERLNGFDENLKILADKDLIIRSYFLNPQCLYCATNAEVALFSGGGTSSNLFKSFKEDIYIYKKIKPGYKYLLYVFQHYPRMWLYSLLHKI